MKAVRNSDDRKKAGGIMVQRMLAIVVLALSFALSPGSAHADDIAIHVTLVSAPSGSFEGYQISGTVSVSPVGVTFTWGIEAAWTDTPAEVNAAIKAAAIAVVEYEGYSVGLFDAKILIGGAASLL